MKFCLRFQKIYNRYMGKLILVRHGKSTWNVEKRFTGWTDVDLAPEGIDEAKQAGSFIRKNELYIDVCFTSYLKRAIKTAWIILDETDWMSVDCIKSWKLNERHYGNWQGRNKGEIKKEVGEEIYFNVRRGYDAAAPALIADDSRHPKYESKYKNIDLSLLPVTESLKDTEKRTVQYYYEAIVPYLVRDKTVLLAAHGNSLRALIRHIEISQQVMCQSWKSKQASL